MKELEEFRSKDKFLPDNKDFYPGVVDPKLRAQLTERINLAVDDFSMLARRGSATENEYQDTIKIGLERFADVYEQVDTEDRERICSYFEELMDIVGLNSSGGHLNNFMYGFDPTGH